MKFISDEEILGELEPDQMNYCLWLIPAWII